MRKPRFIYIALCFVLVTAALLPSLGAAKARSTHAATPAVTELLRGPSHATAGSPVIATLRLTASRPFTARAVGVAVRDSAGLSADYPGAARNVRLGTRIYTFHSRPRTFSPGTYRVFGFWQDASRIYHRLPARTMIVRPVASGLVPSGARPTGAQPTGALPPTGAQPNGIPGAWTLKLADEFNGTGLNTSLWQPGWFGSGVTNPANSNEQACYDSNNVTFPGDGTVHLKVTAVPSTCGGKNEPYTGALLSSNPSDGRAGGGYQFTYGVVEARVYLPPAANGQVANWPAVWTDGQSPWPSNGEDDVLEGLGGQACFHFHSPSGGPGSCVPGNFSGWHTFASDWQPGSVTYYYDGVQVGRITTGITSAPMYLLLNNSVSASYGGPTVAADMQVDYVRVWQH